MRTPRRRLWVTCLAAAIALPVAGVTLAHAAADDPAASLAVAVQIDPVTGDQSPTVHVTARNTSSKPVTVLARDLPKNRQTAQVLSVTKNGAPVAYQGKLVKYPPITDADYVTIAAGASYTTTVDLAADYDLSQPGSYSVGLASPQVRTKPAAGTQAPGKAQVKAGRGGFTTDRGVASKPSAQQYPSDATGGATAQANAVSLAFNGCSSSQQSTVRQAVSDAARYTSNARSWLSSHTSGGSNYTTWFGTYNSSRFSHVNGSFGSIGTELTSKTVTLDCTSTDPYMAFVYANRPYVIYLCPGYWRASATGWDSRAGTLVHESSHFTVNGGAQDYVYGLDQGKQLAKSNPGNAVYNADNIEHFAESL